MIPKSGTRFSDKIMLDTRRRLRRNGTRSTLQGNEPTASRVRFAERQSEDYIMAWTTPTLVEICIGLEINGYLPAEF
jgi:coenzyme PQQ precursor peptide PqqA